VLRKYTTYSGPSRKTGGYLTIPAATSRDIADAKLIKAISLALGAQGSVVVNNTANRVLQLLLNDDGNREVSVSLRKSRERQAVLRQQA